MSVAPQFGLNKIHTDTAGITGPVNDATSAPTGLAPTPVQRITHPLSFLSGGPHPDGAITAAYHDALAKATDSLRGPHGGLVPGSRGTQAPGPAGPSTTAQQNAALAAQPVGGTLGAVTTRLRDRVAQALKGV